LYAPTVVGAARLAGRIPIVIHPTAHDEPPMHLSIVRPALQTADGLVYLTAEERDVVHSVLGPVRGHEAVIGLGVDLPEPRQASEIDAVAARFGLDEWLVSVGRVDPSKGTTELVDWYRRYRSTHEATPALVLVGDRAHRIEISDRPSRSGGHDGGVVQTGIVDEDTKHALVAGARLAVQPSFFESFSLSLVEAWSHGRAALVQGRCAVLAGQVQRSGGGVAYRGYAQFEVALETLLADHELASRLGQSGRRYVGAEYAWSHLLDRYEVFLDQVRGSWERGARHLPG
jgi:glycosyltransferase involved in cell wall biosynthesis